MSRWVWLSRLFLFAGLFLLLALALAQVAIRAGAPVSAGLTPWNVLPLLIAALATSWALTERVERRPLASLGLPPGARALRDLGLGLAIGVCLIGAVVLLLALAGWVRWDRSGAGGGAAVAVVSLGGLLLAAAFVEELLFRGYPFQVLRRSFGPTAAIAVTSVGFGLMHAANPHASPLALVNITLAGVLLATAVWRTGSLWFATGIHLGWNWVMAVSELSVSGLEFDVPGLQPRLTGPTALTGGAFGPEGGLLVTALSLVGIAWIWRWGPREESLSRR